MAVGGDVASVARGVILGASTAAMAVKTGITIAKATALSALELANKESQRWLPFDQINPLLFRQELREGMYGLDMSFGNVQMSCFAINEKLQELDEAQRAYRTLLAKGERIQATREIFRQRSAAITQGFGLGMRVFVCSEMKN